MVALYSGLRAPLWVAEVWKPDYSKDFRLPLLTSAVQAGLPTSVEELIEGKISSSDLLIKNRRSTFFVKVTGDSMLDAGIRPGDTLVVDKSLEVLDGRIVVAQINGELTVKKFRFDGKTIFLEPDNPDYPVIFITEEMEFSIWGVVTQIIHSMI